MAIPVTQKIGDFTFIIGHIPASTSLTAFNQALGLLGPIVGEVFKLSKGKAGEAEIKAALLEGNLEDLIKRAQQVDPKATTELMLSLAAATNVPKVGNLSKENFDAVFTGNLLIMVKWFAAAIKVNFGDFIGAVEKAEK